MKRPALMAGAVILVVAVGAAGAWLTRPPETAQPRMSKAAKARLAAAARATPPAGRAATAISLPEIAPPPEPTSADFARAAAPPPGTTAMAEREPTAAEWMAMPIDELRNRAGADEVPAMEELARRLVHGAGVAKDQQAGAGWLLRAAQRGSAQSSFNVAVMYERGFVVERDSTRAVEWYRKAVDANLPMAKHNLALLLRDGKGAPRNGKEAVELLRSAARQGMAASMFSLGDIYERGDAGAKDPAIALAWFAIAAEFERQTSRDGESALAKMAAQRVQVLQRVLMPGELERAQQFGQAEFKQIVEALQPPKSAGPAPTETAAAPPSTSPPAADPDPDPPGWPKATNDQIRAIQQALVDLKFLRDKPDGAIGPLTRNAVRAFQRSVAMRETGEPTRDVFAALQEAVTRRDAAARLAPPKAEPAAKAEAAKPEQPAAEPTKPSAAVEPGKAEAAKAEAANAEAARAEAAKAEAAKAEAAKAEAAKAEAAKAEAANAEAARAEAAKAEAAKAEAAKAEAAKIAAVKAEAAKVDPPKPALPKIDVTKPAMPPIAVTLDPTKAEPAKAAVATVNLSTPEPPPPPTSAEIARVLPKAEPSAASPMRDPNAWPTATADQVKAIQALLRDLKFSQEAPDGVLGPATRTAIRDYERSLGLAQTGQPSKTLFESLKEMRTLAATKSN